MHRVLVKFSNGNNLQTAFSAEHKCSRKGGAAEVRRHENTNNGESASYYIVTFCKSSFNACKVKGWRPFYDMSWSNVPLGYVNFE